MGTEIERKFLVNGEEWRVGATGTRYRQGYLNADPERSVRIRLAGSIISPTPTPKVRSRPLVIRICTAKEAMER